MFVNSSNMAPGTKKLGMDLTFDIAKAIAHFDKLEYYFDIYDVKEDKEKISIFFRSINDFTVKEIVKNIENFKNITWRQLKIRIKKESKDIVLFKILDSKQKFREPTSVWLERSISIARDGGLEETFARKLIYRTGLHEHSLLLFKDLFMNQSLYEDYMDKINRIKRSEVFYCKTKKKNFVKEGKINNTSESKTTKTHFINSLTAKNIDINYKPIELCGETFKAIWDTGSDVNIISESIVQEKGFIVRHSEDITISNIFNQSIKVDKCVDITINVDNVIMNVEFFVFKTNEATLLLGNKFIKSLQQKKNEIGRLKSMFKNVFNEKSTDGYEDILCTINTKENAKVNIKRRNMSQVEREGAEKAINKLLELGYIELSTSSWCNPMRPVLKPNGEYRITCNMQFLNKIADDNNYTIPKINEIIEKTLGQNFFTIIDLQDGFFQIKIDPKDKYKTAFYFKNNLYQYTRMPQGFKNSPAIFQMIMDKMLKNVIGKKCMVYMDDIIVFGETEKEHDENLKEVLQLLDDNKFKINYKKMQYKDRKVKLLGYIIDGITQKPLGEHQRKILDFQRPTNKKGLQSFLGFANYYRKYIGQLASISEPLYNAIKGITDNDKLNWTEDCENAFNTIKQKINSDIAVHIPDFSKPFILTTDASNVGIGACLQQEINSEYKVIDWASRKLSEAEKKYSITEKEFLAMAWSIKHYDYYLKGRKFRVITDHSALTSSRVKHIFGNMKLERMRESLQHYDFSIEYKKGSELVDADTISRIYENGENNVNQRLPKNVVVDSKGIWYYRINENELRLFPDVDSRSEILRKAHEEHTIHGGRDAMLYKIKKTYYWPKLSDSVTQYIKNCLHCNCNKQKTQGGEVYVKADNALDKVGIDLMFLEQNTPILTCIDYCSRQVDARLLNDKSNDEVLKAIKSIFQQWGMPKQLIIDNGREFKSSKFDAWCKKNNIEIHTTSPGKHQSNGRVERFNRTLWQALRKLYASQSEIDLEKELKRIINTLNDTYHRALKTTPNERWKSNDFTENNVKYQEEFKQLTREKFNIGETVLVEDINTNTSSSKINSKYIFEGKITEILDNDCYMISLGNKIVKRNHANIKKCRKNGHVDIDCSSRN